MLPTLSIVLVILLSLTVGGLRFYFTGNTINAMTLGGLSLAVGTTVDVGIVVVESIMRHLRMGKSPTQAAQNGAAEVAMPALAGTFTTLIVFIPVIFLSGMIKYLFVPLSVAATMTIGASYFVGMTVVRQDFPHEQFLFVVGGIVNAALNVGSPVPINIQVAGSSLEKCREAAERIVDHVKPIPGAADVQIAQALDYPQLDVEVDRARAKSMGLNQKEVAQTILTALASSLAYAPIVWVDPKTGIDFWMGVSEAAARNGAGARVQQAQFQQIQLMDRVAREVAEAHSQVRARHRQIRVAETGIEAATDSYRRNSERIREGQGLPIEVLQAIQSLDQARREYLRTVTDFNEAQFRLYRATGFPLRDVPVEPSSG